MNTQSQYRFYFPFLSLVLVLNLIGGNELIAQDQFSLQNQTNLSNQDTDHQHTNPDWKLVWSDDFDDQDLDTSKWNYEIDGKGGGNGEMEYYTDDPKNVHVEDGSLVITAIKDGTYNGQKHAFTSGRINTKDKGSWLYGRFEARIKVPTGRGVWPAFWMMPQDSVYGGWASSGEIDILEEIGNEPSNAYGTIHYGDKWPGNVHTGDKWHCPTGILASDYHVYALEWEPGVIRWYVDDQLYETQKKWYTKAAKFPAPFNQKFYIIFNFAVGGGWPGPPSASTTFPQSMKVDYVRVYQPDGYVNGDPQTWPGSSSTSGDGSSSDTTKSPSSGDSSPSDPTKPAGS